MQESLLGAGGRIVTNFYPVEISNISPFGSEENWRRSLLSWQHL